jgi:hypothetical protein
LYYSRLTVEKKGLNFDEHKEEVERCIAQDPNQDLYYTVAQDGKWHKIVPVRRQ